MLSLFYWLIDVKGWRRWCVFLEVVGLNSITIYMLKRIVDYKGISHFLFGGIASWFPDALFVESLGVFVLCWLTCWFLHRHKVYLKL
jgi:predicted acyltransferase